MQKLYCYSNTYSFTKKKYSHKHNENDYLVDIFAKFINNFIIKMDIPGNNKLFLSTTYRNFIIVPAFIEKRILILKSVTNILI